MELATKAAWSLLLLVHVWPAAVAVRPGLMRRLYGVQPDGALGVLLTHRGVLFLAIAAVAALAIVDQGGRRIASAAVAVSVLGYLLVYLRAGAPAGPLRTVALVDVAAALPLAWVVFDAWARRAG